MTIADFANLPMLCLYGGLIVVLIVSSVTDLYYRRIPNVLTCSMILVALITYSFTGGISGLVFSVKGLLFALGVFLIPYCMGGLGAGDVKLMGAVGAVLGFGQTVTALGFIAVMGGIIAFVIMVYRKTVKRTFSKLYLAVVFFVTHNDASLLKPDKDEICRDGIPFGLAIASGVFLFFIYLLTTREMAVAFGVS